MALTPTTYYDRGVQKGLSPTFHEERKKKNAALLPLSPEIRGRKKKLVESFFREFL